MRYVTVYKKNSDDVIAQIFEDAKSGEVRAIQDSDYVVIVDGYILQDASELESEGDDEE